MIGEWTGKVRSTPTPKLTLRTREGLADARALTADGRTLEDLDALPVAFDDADVHLQGVPGAEVGNVVAKALAVDEVGGVHGQVTLLEAIGRVAGSRRLPLESDVG